MKGAEEMRHLDVVLASVERDRWGHMGGWDGRLDVAVGDRHDAAVRRPDRLGGSHDRRRARVVSSPLGIRRNRAREILAERYARGELTTEEYRERLEHLR
jgi:hypothetical protein